MIHARYLHRHEEVGENEEGGMARQQRGGAPGQHLKPNLCSSKVLQHTRGPSREGVSCCCFPDFTSLDKEGGDGHVLGSYHWPGIMDHLSELL